MQVVQFLVSADGIHVGIDAVARLYLVLSQRQSLPLRQGVNHLGLRIAQVLDGKRHGAFHTVQIVVDTQSLQHKQGSRHTTQAQFRGDILLEKLFNQFNTLLRLFHVEQGYVIDGFYQLTHNLCFHFYRLSGHFGGQSYKENINLQTKPPFIFAN